MTAAPEFSRIVRVDTLPRDGLRQKIAADAEECRALAQRFGLPAVESLAAQLTVKRSGRGVRVTGEVRAKVTQTCIVTVEPFDVELVEEVDVRFAPPTDGAHKRAPSLEHEIRFEDEDEPDPLIDGKVDLGEIAAEFVALGLDPYPRKPGAAFEAVEEGEGEEEPSPFASLVEARERKEKP